VCVCLSVCPEHNSKTNDPKVFKLDIGIWPLGYPINDMACGFQEHRLGLGLRLGLRQQQYDTGSNQCWNYKQANGRAAMASDSEPRNFLGAPSGRAQIFVNFV